MDSDIADRLTSDVRRHFLVDLRTARNAAFGDAEDFDHVLFAVERLGAFLLGKVEGLGKYREALRQIAGEGMPLRGEVVGAERSRFDRVYDLVNLARNDALHQGAVARHLTTSCVELALILENGLMSKAVRVKDLMVESPTVAKPFESVGSIRRSMLMNGYSYVPTYTNGQWKLISDAALMRYLRASTSGNDRGRRLGTQINEAIKGGLSLDETAIVERDAALESVLDQVGQRPVLVVHEDGIGEAALCGLITSFDVL